MRNFTLRASDTEELVGVTHRRLSGIDQVESATDTIGQFKQKKKLPQMRRIMAIALPRDFTLHYHPLLLSSFS